ncbi:MAG TPA: endolytic transglycosylase MltG [Fimbriimonadaceae bacterium]|nr:endolytic transglycosylase MltG [Fimbriimonadaceae bacterium]HRJ95799.1 endolytic transglycosylase MltG [Fimbriimonadaceae bacterium]
MARKIVRWGLAVLLLLGLAGFGLWRWALGQLEPIGSGAAFYVRFDQRTPLEGALQRLQDKGAVRNADILSRYARWRKRPGTVETGTYEITPGAKADELLASLRKPIRQMVRIPEGWWIARVAKRLEEAGVCPAEDYISLAKQPERFNADVEFPLPKDSLEGYLFPDTYDLPPLLGAEATIRRQLKTFEAKVVKPLENPKDLHRLVIIGSLVEAEVALDAERPIVAGIIESRLAKKMKLQIDATVLYSLQEWKQLEPGVVNTIDSPYNTYRIQGLPPGPIGSPGLASIEAAAKPRATEYLFYVALPNRSHLFAKDYPTHLANIRKRQAALKAQK